MKDFEKYIFVDRGYAQVFKFDNGFGAEVIYQDSDVSHFAELDLLAYKDSHNPEIVEVEGFEDVVLVKDKGHLFELLTRIKDL